MLVTPRGDDRTEKEFDMTEYTSIKNRRSTKFEVDSAMFEHWHTFEATPGVLMVWMRCAAWSHKWGTLGVVSHNLVKGFTSDLKRMRGHELWFTHHPDEGLWELNHFKEFTRPTQLPARAPIPARVRELVYERDAHQCVQCGSTTRLSLDHIHPWSLGGEDTLENLRTLCIPCNSRKGAKID